MVSLPTGYGFMQQPVGYVMKKAEKDTRQQLSRGHDHGHEHEN